ncbi:PREDICTED: uncharacterized protein LOC109580692 [Amphimedon queenslandica]|nr:PREDICTED: uncharacterized protein LOC109580692 [Amphimedon queenslandica]|eukprot:XP_019849699.1 PREDICTED: uncharacterized protein LOC109580692 [Amphimedon queenslandica]
MACIEGDGVQNVGEQRATSEAENNRANAEEYSEDKVVDATQNFSPGDMTVFGVNLGVKLEKIQTIKADSADSKLHGLQIYKEWRKSKGPQLTQEDHDQLSNAFTKCGHRRSDLALRRRTTTVELKQSAVYPILETLFDNRLKSNVDIAKLKNFGLALKMESADIDNIIVLNQNKGEYEAVIALAIFTAWKSNISPSDDNDAKACEILNAAYKAMTDEMATTPTSLMPGSPSLNFDAKGTDPKDTDPLISPKTGTHDTKMTNYKIAACVSLIFCLIVAISVEVSLLTLAFSYKQEETVTILPGDTIRLPLPAYVPPSLDIVLWGQEDTCSAEVLLAKCSNIETREEVLSFLPHIDFNYLVSGSSVTISESVIRPYEIWLFSEEVDADSAVKEQFRGHHCPSATDHEALCALLKVGEEAVTIDVTESSYYFFRCDQFPFNCSQVNTWGINKMVYDFNVPPDDIIDSAIVHVQNISSRIRIRSSYFYSEGSVSDLCLLAQLNTTVCGSDNLIYRMDMIYSSIFHEVLVYATILVGLIMTVLLIACLVWCYRNRCKTTQ